MSALIIIAVAAIFVAIWAVSYRSGYGRAVNEVNDMLNKMLHDGVVKREFTPEEFDRWARHNGYRVTFKQHEGGDR